MRAIMGRVKLCFTRVYFQNPLAAAEQRGGVAHGATVGRAHKNPFRSGTGRKTNTAVHNDIGAIGLNGGTFALGRGIGKELRVGYVREKFSLTAKRDGRRLPA